MGSGAAQGFKLSLPESAHKLAYTAVSMGLTKMDDDALAAEPRFGVFRTTVVALSLAEMGDKTQVATVILAAQYQAYYAVIVGTTLSMMLANGPVVWLGERMTRLLPTRAV